METVAFVLHDSVNDPKAELWFAEPAGFTALPFEVFLSEPGSPAADNLHAAVAPFLDSAPDELLRQQFIADVASGQQLLGVLREFGTVHCSIGLHRDDVDETGANSRPLLSFFTIAWRDTAVAPRGVTAARAVTSADGHTGIEFLELPCGPATLSESTLTPSVESGLQQQSLLQIHAHLPHPDCKRLAVLTVSTTAMARRAEYRGIIQQIAETVSFENPLDSGVSEKIRLNLRSSDASNM
ncbi:hypothetical protein AB0945_11765 [Streptomyces sp. NPDC005474]|uniref:hypothetical protein n=1 Tax=Streptomyces sp. NPDC005474 TaxID=3154878 RepID=UPI0034544328